MIYLRKSHHDNLAWRRVRVDPARLRCDGKVYDGPVPKPWGWEMETFRNEACSVWRLEIDGGAATSLHCHTQKTCLLLVERGRIKLTTLGGEYLLRLGDGALIESGVFHRSESALGATVIETEWPPNRNDLVRLDDQYGRVGKGYP